MATMIHEPQKISHVSQATVYIVDDDAELCQSIEWLIQSVGLRAKVFPSAQDFLRNLDPAPSGCILLDVRMPGMSGIELQEQLRRQGVDLPVILLTGHAEVPLVVGRDGETLTVRVTSGDRNRFLKGPSLH